MAVNLISTGEFKDFIKGDPAIILFQSPMCRNSVVMALEFDKLAKTFSSELKCCVERN